MDKESWKNDLLQGGDKNYGTLMIDATSAPSDIRYPIDLSLLNEGREMLEGIIDTLWRELENNGGIKPQM